MIHQRLTRFVASFAALSLLSLGMAQSSYGAVITTGDAIAMENRSQQIERISTFLTRDSVRDQLVAFGVDAGLAAERVAGLTDAELAKLDSRIAELEAGGDAIAVIGLVFLVLMILELVGITDIFKAF